MKDNTKRLIRNAGSFLGVIAVSVFLLWIMSLTAARVSESTAGSALKNRYEGILGAEEYEEIDISEAGEPYGDITAAYRGISSGRTKGYIIEMTVQGYGGEIELTVGVSADAKRLTGVSVGRHSETEGLGGRIADNAFLAQFVNAACPLELGRSALSDGTYIAAEEGFDAGYKNTVTVTVENGIITHALWDAESESGGKSKRQASIDGEYVMTAEGLMWHEQAQLMEARLIDLQDPSKIVFGADGKTDAVAGVSIKITPFVALSQQCCAQAGGSSDYSAIDGISGATVSSTAVTDGANTAVRFTENFILSSGGAVSAEGSGSDMNG